AFNRAADKFLVLERSVDVGCVEEIDAEFDGAMDGTNGLVLIARSVELGHAHAAESFGRNGQTTAAKLASFHGYPLSRNKEPVVHLQESDAGVLDAIYGSTDTRKSMSSVP